MGEKDRRRAPRDPPARSALGPSRRVAWVRRIGQLDVTKWDVGGRSNPSDASRLGVYRVKVLFVAGFGPIAHDTRSSRKLYRDVLGIRFTAVGEYLHTEKLKGANTFALWPLSQAAESCFGTSTWPKSLPTPQAWLEFDVDDVPKATAELKRRGYRLLVESRTEPWGQVVSRLLGPEGLLVGVTYTPWMRKAKRKRSASS